MLRKNIRGFWRNCKYWGLDIYELSENKIILKVQSAGVGKIYSNVKLGSKRRLLWRKGGINGNGSIIKIKIVD